MQQVGRETTRPTDEGESWTERENTRKFKDKKKKGGVWLTEG